MRFLNELIQVVPTLMRLQLAGMCGVLLFSQHAYAGFVNYYDLNNFSLIQTNADGSAATPDFGNTVIFTGPNNGSGLMGMSDLIIAAAAAGNVQFNYQYLTLDVPGGDAGGYLVSDNFSQLADTDGESGTVQFPVLAGQYFGFRITSTDNTGEPGVLIISDFSAPGGTEGAIPEPSTYTLSLLGIIFIFIAWARTRRLRLSSRCGRRINGVVCVLALVTCSALTVSGQQTFYTGTDATGQLQLVRTVNVSMSAFLGAATATPQVRGPALGRNGASPEYRKIPPRQLRPPITVPAVAGPGVLSSPSLTLQNTVTTQTLSVSPGGGTFGQLGLTHRDQRLANSGNQFSIEPPSPSIAVGNGYVLEGVNNAVQVYSVAGVSLLPRVLSTNELFGLPPAIDRATGINGPYPTDMRVFYDHTINRWMVLQRVQDNDTAGNPLNSSRIYLAVSQTGDPTGTYNIYTMDTTNALAFGCPCVADYPQIGADQYGFYISTNQFNTFSQQFVNAVIFAISKASLAIGVNSPTMSRFDTRFLNGYEFAIQPASTPPGASYFLANGGLQYFVSSRGNSAVDNRLAVWAMYNTASLGTANPAPVLVQNTFPALTYTFPNVAGQRSGPLPYGSSLSPPGNLAFIDGGDTRVLSVFYASGRLYVTLSTQTSDAAGRSVIGAAFVILSPTFRAGVLSAPVLRQGYLATNNNHLLRPSIAVNRQGRGAVALTLVGPDYYPSAAFVAIDTFSTAAVLQVPAFGAFPEDGFTGYPGGGTGIARWGDYSAAAATQDGSVWMAMQYIPNALRTEAANWGTYLVRYLP